MSTLLDSGVTPISSVNSRVLCVDLDGTLVATDLLWESVISAIRRHPVVLVMLPMWLLQGRSHLKRRLAERAVLDFEALPYRREVVSYLEEARAQGRRIVLATASDSILAHGVARYLGLFDDVLASDGVTNLKGAAKADLLVKRYGERNFDYVGDCWVDIPCWDKAIDAITIGVFDTARVPHLRRLPDAAPAQPFRLSRLVAAVRPHQWIKNVLIFVPLLAAHLFSAAGAWSAFLAFLCLSFVASGGYVVNDLLDLASDRRHARKRTRPFASGDLAIPVGFAIVVVAWVLGFGIAALALPLDFVGILAVYLLGSIAYSVRLKREPVLDVMFLAGLYVVRVIAGGLATGVPVSTWLLAFTLFVCLSLAFLKRFIEIVAHVSDAQLPGRGYSSADAPWLQSAGLVSAYLSVVVLAIYVNNPDVTRLYAHPQRLLLMCPIILYWATRTWFKASRRILHDDPVVAVAVDPVTHVLLAMSVVILVSAM
jgi:4-hydroxybenzoate polyprenyltransferase